MPNREQIIKEKIKEIGADSFPDDEVTWNIEKIIHKGYSRSFEAVPTPSTVGYKKFKFILGFTDERNFYVVGCYCWHSDKRTNCPRIFDHLFLKSK
jgi:hypothetical protein